MLKGGRLIRPGSGTNSTACLTSQFLGGRLLTGMSSTKRASGVSWSGLFFRGRGPNNPGPPSCPYSRTSCKRCSAKFALTEFSEILAPASQLCYLAGERSGGKRVGQGEEKACDE